MAVSAIQYGKTVIIGYDAGHKDYPVLGIYKDPKIASFVVPAHLSAHPDTTHWPSHKFTGIEVAGPDNTEVLTYRKLPGPTLTGQEYDAQLDIVSTFTELVSSTGDNLGDAKTEIQPIDAIRDKVRTIVAPITALQAFVQRFPGTTNLNLPDELVSVAAIFETSGDDSTSEDTGNGSATGTSASLSLACHSVTETGVTVIPDIQVEISQTWAQNVPIEHFFFFLAMPVTTANIITKLNGILNPLTVASWPTFKPVAHTVTVAGGRMNARASATVQQHVALSTETASRTYSVGKGTSMSSGVTIKTVRIPPTIHPIVNIAFGGTPNPYTLTKTATARAQLVAATNWPHVDSEDVIATASVEAIIDPVSFAATAGTNAIPASGLYIKDVDVEPWRYGWARVHAAVFDFASL